MNGIDARTPCTNFVTCLKTAGIQFVGRYYTTNLASDKILTRAEAVALSQASISIVAVFESNGTSYDHFDQDQGETDGAAAYNYAKSTIGQPAGTTIYFAVDYDAAKNEIDNDITGYFKGVDQAMRAGAGGPSEYAIGVYGSGLTCSTLIGNGSASMGWLSLSKGWRGYSGFKDQANILQSLGSPMCNGGLNVDNDDGRLPFGAFPLPMAIAV